MLENTNLVPMQNNNGMINWTNSLKQMLSHVSEEEFIQMVLPIVHLLPVNNVQFLLLNCTSEEIPLIIKRLDNANNVNIIAEETDDGIVAVELAKHKFLSLDSLNILVDRFITPYHMELYTKHQNADLTLLRKIKNFIMDKLDDSEWEQFIPYILENIGGHSASDYELLDELVIYVDNFEIEMKHYENLCNELKKQNNKEPWRKSRSPFQNNEDTEEHRLYDFNVTKIKRYFGVLLAVASNSNTSQERLHMLFTKYSNKSVHNVDRDVPGLAMQMLGYTHADSVGYRVLRNPSLEESFRDKYLEALLDEEHGVYQSDPDGKAYLQRISEADDEKVLRSIWKLWCKKEDDKERFWHFFPYLKEVARCFCENKLTPCDVIDDIVTRICTIHGNHKHVFYEDLQSIINAELSEVSFNKVIDALRNIELCDPHYMDACIPKVLNHLTKNITISGSAIRNAYELTISLQNRGLESLCNLAGNSSVTGLDDEFGKSTIVLVRRNFARRTDNLKWLEILQNDSARDVCVAARRRHSQLTKQTLLLSIFEKQQVISNNINQEV